MEKKEEEEAITKRFIFQTNAGKLLLFTIFAVKNRMENSLKLEVLLFEC